MIVLDTNVLSELMSLDCDERVSQWQRGLAGEQECLTGTIVQEVEFGLRTMPHSTRRDQLVQVWEGMLRRYGRCVLDYGKAEALKTAEIMAKARSGGRVLHLADAQIAGCCLTHDATLATRNVKDLDFIDGLKLVNPFDSAPVV